LPNGLPPFGPGEIRIEPVEMKKRGESLISKPSNTLPDPACRSPTTAPMPGLRLWLIATRLHLDLRNVKARPSDGPLRRDDQGRHRLRKGSGGRVAYRLSSYRRFNLVLWINPYGKPRPQGGTSRQGMSFILCPLPPPIPLWRDGARSGR
jgi:hypothetical protein